jgi:CheY-like chemotaxis protein
MEKKRILVVDDEVGITTMLKRGLEATGEYEVHTENAGREALNAARMFKPHLVLCDVMMPDIDGGEVAAHFQQDNQLKDIPFIFLTAIIKKEEAGAEGSTIAGHTFLAKPIKFSELIKQIEAHIKT